MIRCCKTIAFCFFSCNIFFIRSFNKLEVMQYVSQHKFENAALIIIDMWDKHWCETVSLESNLLAFQINKFASKFRQHGGQVVHVPYFGFNDPSPAVKSAIAQQFVKFSAMRGCKCCGSTCKKDKNKSVWTKVHPFIEINKMDYLITKIKDLLTLRNIKLYFLIGQHANECMLERPIGAFALKELNKNFCIIKDLANDDFVYTCPESTKRDFFSLIEELLCPLIISGELISLVEKSIPDVKK